MCASATPWSTTAPAALAPAASPKATPGPLIEKEIEIINKLGLHARASAKLTQLAGQLGQWEITPSGTEGYRKAEVTLGGVDTRDLSSQTMESKQAGLYFIGEVVDVTGWLGGYNFQWAWSSAYACAQGLAARHGA